MKKIILNLLKKIRTFLTNDLLNQGKILEELYSKNERILLNQGKILEELSSKNERILLNQGKILEELYSKKEAEKLGDYEWGVFSQWGEDGIIQFLVREVKIKNKTFIEFGVEDFFESNCRYLLMASDWQGFVIDGSEENISRLQNSYFYWRHDLQSVAAFVDKENINELLKKSEFDRDLGILSVDIDGNDYHILDELNVFEPRIIVSEFNPYFGTERAISVPYDPKFYRTEKHYSNLYFGASIKAIEHVLNGKGYTLVGTGMTGGNAYFVRNDLMTEKLSLLAKKAISFINVLLRESRDKEGYLSFLRGEDRINEIKGLQVLNVKTGLIETL